MFDFRDLKTMHSTGRSLSELATCMTKFPQTLVNVLVNSRKSLQDMPEVTQAIEQAERELGERGRILFRYSGTELLARVMVEAESENTVNRLAETIAEAIRKEQ